MSGLEKATPANTVDVLNTPLTFKTLTEMSHTDLVPVEYQGNPMKMLTAMLMGKELGMTALESLRRIHVIKGKPSPSAEWMIGRVFAAGHSIIALEQTDKQCVVEGTRYRPDGSVLVTTKVTYTIEMAERAGLTNGPGKSWRHYPEIMLFWRASAQIARQMFGDLLGGLIHLAEELGVDEGTPEPIPENAGAKPAVEVEVVDAVIIEPEPVEAAVAVVDENGDPLVMTTVTPPIPAAPVGKPAETEQQTPRAAAGEVFCPGCYLLYGQTRIAVVHNDSGRGPKWKCQAPADKCGGKNEDTEGKEHAWSGWNSTWSMSVTKWADSVGADVAELLTVWKQEQPQESEQSK